MSRAIRDHLRGNVVGYVALFCFAMSGTAVALDGSNTVFSDDIVNGEVKSADIGTSEVTSPDIANGTVVSVDIGPGGVDTADVADDAIHNEQIVQGGVRTSEIGDGQVQSADVLDDSLGTADIGTNGVGDDEVAPLNGDANIVDETLTTFDIQSNAIQTDEIQDETVGKGDIGAAAVGASELGDGVVTRPGSAVNVPGGTAENGSYSVGTATASCNAGEELIGGSGQWTPDDNSGGDLELWLGEVRYNTGAESMIVDGGNDSGADHTITAVALCLQV
jgi:hypothetical protein